MVLLTERLEMRHQRVAEFISWNLHCCFDVFPIIRRRSVHLYIKQ
jgi:hypothetical protein